MRLFGRLLLILLLMLGNVFAAVVVNSLDTRDVLSAVYYAAVTNNEIGIVYPNYGLNHVFYVSANKDVLLIESSNYPVVIGLEEALGSRGSRVNVLTSTDAQKTNMELAEKSGARSFVLLDPVYGYNAVSALAYAKLNGMYLLIAEKNNSEQLAAFLKSKKPQSILIYGHVDNEIKESLNKSGLRYEEINNGDKYDDNIQILERYFSQNPSKRQVLICDGNGIEDTIATGNDPAIFIGPIVPQDIYNYLKKKVETGQISVGLVVDAEYLQTAYNLKERINSELGSKKLSVLVKIGQSVAGMEGTPAAVPFIQLSGPIAGLAIEKIEYNTDKKAFEVTYANTGNAAEYAKSTLVVFVDGNYAGTMGDTQPFAIPKGSKIGKEYKMNVSEGELAVNITSLYGISKKSQDFGIVQLFNVGRISYIDNSVVEISDIRLERERNELFVTMLNNGTVPAYVLPGVSLLGESTINIDGDKIYLKPNDGKTIRFLLPSTASERIIAKANYGAREGFLEKYVEKEYVPPSFVFDMNYAYMALILLLIIIVAYLLLERKRDGGNKPKKTAEEVPEQSGPQPGGKTLQQPSA